MRVSTTLQTIVQFVLLNVFVFLFTVQDASASIGIGYNIVIIIGAIPAYATVFIVSHLIKRVRSNSNQETAQPAQ